MATGKKGGMTCTYVVGRYRPAGNFAGQYQKNVPRGTFNEGVCKKLNSIVKEIEDSSSKKKLNFVNTDDKFGQEKVANYGGKLNNDEKPSFFNGNSHKGAEKISKSGNDGKHGGLKNTSKNGKNDDNVIHLDEKTDSVEQAESLINKNKDKKKNKDKTATKNKSKAQNVQNSRPTTKGNKVQNNKHQSSKANYAKVANANVDQAVDMRITSGVPLSRYSGQKFVIKTNYDAVTKHEPLAQQREIDSTSDDFAQKGLTAHNAFRKIHGTPPLTLDPKMSAESAEYAKLIAEKGSLIHSKTNGKYGENLAMGCTSKSEEMSAEEATKNW